jgi:L-ribulose-5-phosphate 3-epimerase
VTQQDRLSIAQRASRREFLKTSAALAASPLAPLLASPQSRWFKIGLIEWIIGKQGDPTSFDFAKEVGLDGVQIDMGPEKDPMRLCFPDMQQAYRDAASRTGLEIASLSVDRLNFVPLKRDPKAAECLSKSIDVCKALGLKIIMAPCFGPAALDMNNPTEIERLVQSLKQVMPQAEKEGVTVGLESLVSAEDNLRIIDRVGSSALRVYYDVGNATDKGHDAIKEIRTLGKRKLICEFHFKDGRHMLGRGRIDFKQVRKAIDDIEYSGWIQIETPAIHGLVSDYTTTRKYLKAVFPPKG